MNQSRPRLKLSISNSSALKSRSLAMVTQTWAQAITADYSPTRIGTPSTVLSVSMPTQSSTLPGLCLSYSWEGSFSQGQPQPWASRCSLEESSIGMGI
ncbi:hypothetical protein FGO68_gene4170 [Halteria grandinella]|uniref:Uncharacterized protein n=1 Tax=Halteria grandinella TaxID=5974 RepID=A0A8J8NI04_HALGN|nr:hypothetical protein FGO68_gene4170 [Halteria grandinella]